MLMQMSNFLNVASIGFIVLTNLELEPTCMSLNHGKQNGDERDHLNMSLR